MRTPGVSRRQPPCQVFPCQTTASPGSWFMVTPREPERRLGLNKVHPTFMGIYACREGWLVVTAGGPRLWWSFCEMLGFTDWLQDSTLDTRAGRFGRLPEMDARIGAHPHGRLSLFHGRGRSAKCGDASHHHGAGCARGVAQSLLRTSLDERIPSQIADAFVVWKRPIVGAAPAISMVVLVQFIQATQLINGDALTAAPGLLCLALLSGFGERFIVGTIEQVSKKFQAETRD